MNKKIPFILLGLSLFIIVSCSSTPEPVEETPAEETVPEEVIEETPVEEPVEEVDEGPTPVSPEELSLARQALEKAEMVEASRFAPELMKEAYAEMQEAEALMKDDPDKARLLLASVIAKSNEAYDQGRIGLKAEAHQVLDDLDAKLLSIEADKYSPEPYALVQKQYAETRAYIEAEDISNAREGISLSQIKTSNLYKSLDQNIRWIGILERDTKTYLGDAEAEEAYLWADEEFNKASYLLSQGMIQFRQYKIEDSEATLKEAKFRAKNTLYLTRKLKKQAEIDAKLMQVQMELEEASTLTVQTEDGSIEEADPWSGHEYLSENPLLEIEAEEYEAEESELTEYNLDQEVVEEEEEEIQLISEKPAPKTLLDQAKELWQMAIAERNAGNYDKSRELLSQAEAYIQAYKANAVGKTYTVVYRKTNTDCLWRIAEFEEIYDDPYLWPKIWQRNQKAIPNPDLIYPGQVLIIPPVE